MIPSDPKWSQVAIAEADLLLLHLPPNYWNVQNEHEFVASDPKGNVLHIASSQISWVWTMSETAYQLHPTPMFHSAYLCVLDLRLRSIKSERFWTILKGLNRDGHLPGTIQATQVQLCWWPVAALADCDISRLAALQPLHQGPWWPFAGDAFYITLILCNIYRFVIVI